MVLGSFLGHFSSVLLDSVFKTKQLRSVLGKFLRPYYLFRYLSFKTSRIPITIFFILTYILSLISTSYSNDTFLQLLEFSLHPLIFVFLLLPKFVEPLASLVGLSPTLLFPLLIFSPENRSKKYFYSNGILISTYVFSHANVFGSSSI